MEKKTTKATIWVDHGNETEGIDTGAGEQVNVKIECAGPDYGKVGATLHEPHNSHCVAP